MARILVTGASGFIGRHAVARLAAGGHRVVATGRDAARLHASSQAAEVVVHDLANDPLDPLVQGCDTVVHCAALSAPWGRAQDFWQANVIATERLLDASRRHRVRRFIHLGSPSIYFRFRDQYGVGEDFVPPRRWITEYARSKWESERRVVACSDSRLETLILRPRAVFGEGDRAILPRLLAVAARGWFPLIESGRAQIDITHVDNLVDLLAHCVDADLPANGRAYNVSNGEPIRVRELLEDLFARLELRVKLLPVPRHLALPMASLAERIARLKRGCPEPRLTRYGIGVIGFSQTLDLRRARDELDYRPRMSVADGVARFAQWWRTHDGA